MCILYAPTPVVSPLAQFLTVCLLVLSLSKQKAPQGWAWGYLATGISPAKSTVPDPKQAPNK